MGMTSKAVVLAGGTGSRLRPITHTVAKQLIPLANKPVLHYIIEDLRAAGIDEIGIVLGHNTPEQIQSVLGDGSDYDVEITYIFQGEPLGLAHAVGCAEQFVGDDPFLVYFGDTILDSSITRQLTESFDPSEHDLALSLQAVENPSRFGVAEFDDNDNIRRVHEKPEDPPSDLAYIGVVGFTNRVFDVIEGMDTSWRGELELTEAIDQMLVAGGNAAMRIEDGVWRDVGTPEDVIETNSLLLDRIEDERSGYVSPDAVISGPIQVAPDSTIEADVTVNGPVVIGEETIIKSGTEIGPHTSIGKNCTVETKHLQASVVMKDTVIETDEPLDQSLIGQNVTITESAEKGSFGVDKTASQPKSLIIGDDSKVTF